MLFWLALGYYRNLLCIAGVEVDWFRDTNARFLGYFNEVGEACRSILPVAVVNATYAVVALYILADTYDKGTKANKVSNQLIIYRKLQNTIQ